MVIFVSLLDTFLGILTVDAHALIPGNQANTYPVMTALWKSLSKCAR